MTDQLKQLFYFPAALFLFSLVLLGKGSAMLSDVPNRKPETQLSWPKEYSFGDIFFTPDGTHLVGTCRDLRTKEGIILFWDIKTYKLVRTLRQPDAVSTAVFTPDGQQLVTGGWDNKMYIFTAPDWKIKHVFDYDPPNQFAQSLAMFPDGKRFLSGNSGYRGPRLWDLSNREATPLGGSREQVVDLAVSRDGKRFAVAYSAPLTEVWDTDKLRVIGRLELAKTELRQGVFVSVTFSPDGKWIATGSVGTVTNPNHQLVVTLWDAATLKKYKECDGLSDVPEALAFTPDSKLLVSCMGAEENIPAKVCIWEVESGKLVYSFSPWKHGCIRQALSPDGRWLVTRGVDGTLRLWDFEKIRREISK